MTQTDPADVNSRSAQRMFTALHATHQHADTKAGILAATQAVLVGTAETWSRQAVRAWDHGGAAGVCAGALLALFICGLLGGTWSLAATLRPRILRPSGANRYSFVHLARAPTPLPPEGGHADEAAEHAELSLTVQFLARVALIKYRCLADAVVCTAVMGISAGLSVALQPVLT